MLQRSVFVGAAGGCREKKAVWLDGWRRAREEEDFHLDGLGAGWKETLLGIK